MDLITLVAFDIIKNKERIVDIASIYGYSRTMDSNLRIGGIPMKYLFVGRVLKQGNRYFMKIPFNIWEVCGQKGLIPVKVCIHDFRFECKLVPKGDGIYYIPIAKSVINQIDYNDEVSISFEMISGLTRINLGSPYTMENPIRKIDSIQKITYPKDGYCGQMCIAMLTGLSVDEIIDIMQSRAWQCSFSKLLEALDYFGISYDDKFTYTKGRNVVLPECCIVNVKSEHISHLALYYKGEYYDSEDFGVDNIISYLKINI